MPYELYPISLRLPLGLGRVNCYLIRTASTWILIDTGLSTRQAALDRALAQTGCAPGDLDLIILTHGDFDHTGNAAHLARTHDARVAMHRDDDAMLIQGDMFHNRRRPAAFIVWLANTIFRFRADDHYEPDMLLADGDSLAPYGLDARIVSIPGHSKGSIGVLTGKDELFIGDLLVNSGHAPAMNDICDDPEAMAASIERLATLGVDTVYPGHGAPFELHAFLKGS